MKQISNAVNLKSTEILAETKKYTSKQKVGILNGFKNVCKSITVNLDASDKITHDQFVLEKLMKKQISLTTSTINDFHAFFQKF